MQTVLASVIIKKLYYFQPILYLSRGKTNPSSYVYLHKKPFGSYSFAAVDAAPNPWPKKPSNFLGNINQVIKLAYK